MTKLEQVAEWHDANAAFAVDADTLAFHADCAAAIREAMESIRTALSIVENCEVSSGVCGCGDDMAHHAEPMAAGHSPTDYGAYTAWRWADAARAILNTNPEGTSDAE